MSTSLSSVISPRTSTEKGGPLHIVSSQDGEDLLAQLFDLVGHIFRLKPSSGYRREKKSNLLLG